MSSTVWEAVDKRDESRVALKIMKSTISYKEIRRETKILEAVRGADGEANGRENVMMLCECFKIKAGDQLSYVMVFPFMKNNLLNFKALYSYEEVKSIMKQICRGLWYIHRTCYVIHTDMKLENVMIQIQPDQDIQLKVQLADLGNACWVDNQFTEEIQTLQYRSPEVIIGAGFCCSADIWSVACMAFEMATGDYLFNPSKADEEADHMAQIVGLLGRVPKQMATSKIAKRILKTNGTVRRLLVETKVRILGNLLVAKTNWEEHQRTEFIKFIQPIILAIRDPSGNFSTNSGSI